MTRAARWLSALTVLAALAMLVAACAALRTAPDAAGLTPDQTAAQRIIYLHVPSAWLSILAFAVTAAAGALHLVTRQRRWDGLAASSAEIGLVFTLATAASGAVWARPAWNTWWTWDPRLTTYAIMFLLFVAYFMLRGAIDDREQRARIAAVYGLFAFLSAPITFMSIRWWRTIHPVLFDAQGFGLSAGMRPAFYAGLVAFTLLYATLLAHRCRLERARDELAALSERLEH